MPSFTPDDLTPDEPTRHRAEVAPARSLNRHAGRHAGDRAATADVRELGAARRAASRSWVEFPYYAHRFGVRGRQFSHGDSAWLVTLCDLPRSAALGQVRWRATVLAARGMPRWLLECHLETLREELEQAVPERYGRYAVLAEAARELWLARQPAVPDPLLEALDAGFAERVGSPWRRRFRRMGAVLAAAVADERAGIEGAVSSVEVWACDPARFPEPWIDAARETIAEARAVAP